MRRLRAEIAPVDSHETSRAAGVDVYMGKARLLAVATFLSPHEIQVGDRRLRFRKAVVATGGRAKVPPIPGLECRGVVKGWVVSDGWDKQTPFLTNATLFNLTALPKRLVVLGAGPISLEMAQAFRRFGSEARPDMMVTCWCWVMSWLYHGCGLVIATAASSTGVYVSGSFQWSLSWFMAIQGVPLERSPQVTVLEVAPEIMGAEDSDAAALLREVFQEETGLWVAAGRIPNVEGLGLEAAGVQCSPGGVKVNDDLTTSNPDILAIGDVIERPDTRFTHMNALFPDSDALPVNAASRRLSELVVPRCTYTEPEVASCGVSNDAWLPLAG
eukprot:Skav215045  [mRNA]  locus=scaffold2053:45503:52508:+ [translate_table: standard]